VKAILSIALVACGSPPTKPAETPGSGSTAPPLVTLDATAALGSGSAASTKRCLPVVSKECGCVYSCGTGELRDGKWIVGHSFWKNTELAAVVEDWCVGGECTPAFAVEIVCDIRCGRKPADASCHFDDAGTCVGAPST
jgi:hypothetical protein